MDFLVFKVFMYMKFLLTESKLKGAIESFIRKTYPEVINVIFETKSVMLGSTDGQPIIRRTTIKVIGDPSDVLSGKPKSEYRLVLEFKRSIKENVNNVFGLNIYEYGSEWDIEVFVLSLKEV